MQFVLEYLRPEAAASMVSEVKTDVRFELSIPEYPLVPILEVVRCNLNFQGCKARASVTSEVNTDARF